MEFHQNDLSDLDELTEEHLGFSALSDGLGFSRGKSKTAVKARTELPEEMDADFPGMVSPAREPAANKPYYGAGAVAAGPALPAPAMKASRPAPAAQPTQPTAAKVLAEPAAPRWLRLSAFLLDALLILVPLAVAWIVSFGPDSRELFLQDPRAPLLLFTVIFAVYFLLSESFGGQSLAKMMLGLRVVEDDKYQKPTGFRHAVARMGLFVIGALCFGLGFLASFWDAKRRPWHDRYSGSIVRRKA